MAYELDDLSTLEMVKKWYRTSSSQTSTWRKDAEQAYDLVAGEQWDEADKKILEDQDRPTVTFNRIGPVIASISGMEVNNRQQVRFIPRTPDDTPINESLTMIADWIRDNTDAEDEESEAFRDCLITGMGWMETRTDYVDNPDGDIVMERVDPLEMYWDASAKKRNLADSSYLMRVRDIDKADAEAMFPDAEEGDLNASWAAIDETDKLSRGSDPDAYEEEAEKKVQSSGKVRLVECQWREKEAYWRASNPVTGEVESLSEAEYKAVKKKKLVVDGIKQYRNITKRAFIGRVVLEEEVMNTGGSFTWHCITGNRDRNNNSWYGPTRGMKNPQQYANKWLSQSLHIFNTNAKGGVMAEKDAVASVRDFEESWASSDRVTWVQPGALAAGKIDRKPQAELPSQLDRMMQFAVSSIRDTSGVNLEMLGMADRQQAGVLEQQRKQSAMTVLAPMFDSLRRYRKAQSRLLLYYIQNFLSDGRKLRIVGQEYQQTVAVTSDITAGEYDVVIDTAHTSANQKEATWAILSQMLPVIIKMGMPPNVWMEMLEASPLPSSTVSKINKAMKEEAAKPKPPPPEIQKAQLDMQIKQQGAQFDMQQAQQKMQVDAQQQQFDMQMEMRKSEIEIQSMIEKNNATIQMMREKAHADIEIAAAKAKNEIMLKHAAEQPPPPPEAPEDERIDSLLLGMDALIRLMSSPKMLITDANGKIIGAKVVQA